MAYFIRNGLVLAGVNTNPLIALTENRTNPLITKDLVKNYTIKPEPIVSVKSDTVKYPTEIPIVKDATRHDVKPVSVKSDDAVKYPIEVPVIKHEAQAPIIKDTIPATVEDATQHEVKPNTVKYPTEVPVIKHEVQALSVKDATQYEAKPNSVKYDALGIDPKALDAIIKRLSLTIENTITQAIENLKQEFSVKYDSLIVKPHFTETKSNTVKDVQQKATLCKPISFSAAISPSTENKNPSKIKYCAPCEGFIVKQTFLTENTPSADNQNQQVHFTVSKIKEESKNTPSTDNKNQQEHFTLTENPTTHTIEQKETIPNHETHQSIHRHELVHPPKENEAEPETKQQEQQTNKPQAAPENKPALVIKMKKEEQEEEQPYKWVESKLINRIEEKIENITKERVLKTPFSYWGLDQTMYVDWVSVRLCCLIESMIKLSNYSNIDKHTLLCITDAFNRLVNSKSYKNLPDNYPYTELIKELCIKLNSLVQSNSYSEQLKFTLSPELKSTLISTRYKMLKFFSPMKFSELNFIEEKSLQEIKEEREQERQEDEKQRQERRQKQRKNWQILDKTRFTKSSLIKEI